MLQTAILTTGRDTGHLLKVSQRSNVGFPRNLSGNEQLSTFKADRSHTADPLIHCWFVTGFDGGSPLSVFLLEEFTCCKLP